jgi:hypothetical protein
MPIRLNISRQLGCSLAMLLLTSFAAHAQTPSPFPTTTRERIERDRVEREFEGRVRDLRNLRKEYPPRSVSEFYSRPVKLSAEQKKLLEPSEAHKATFASFLRQPNTGLVRLLPREKFDRTTAMPLRGGGAFYSFTKASHNYSPFSDILFQDGQFRTGLFSLHLGLMTMQGETSLEQLTADNKAVRFLHGFAAPLDYQDFLIQVDNNKEGFEVEGNLYKSVFPVRLNTTYVLRSTIHDGPDTVVAFRVVGRDADGGVTLLWKRMHKLKTKKLKNIPEM